MSEVTTKELPDGWQLCKLGDVMRLKNGYAFKSKDYSESGTPLIRISDLKEGVVTLGKAVYIPDELVNEDFLVENGDLLIAMSGATTGKIGVYKGVNPALQNQRVGNFKIIDETVVDKRYRDYYVSSLRKDIEGAAYGGAQPNISSKGIEEFEFPLAPPEQQKRIVAKIEELFSHIDAGIEALKKAKQLLKQYRQSVLKAAVTGELTKEWREANKDRLEPASQLLERILKERRRKWEEQQLEQFKAKGKMPKGDKWKGKYKEPALGKERFFSCLPPEWSVATIDQLAKEVRYGTSSKTNDDDTGVPVIRMGNIVEGVLNYSKLKYLPADHNEFPELLLDDKDLLFNRTNSAELVGKTAIFRDTGKQTSLASYLIRVRMLTEVESEFIAFYINSSCGKNWIKSCVSQNVGQANVNGTKLKDLVVPLPSHKEQLEIVRCVEDKLQSAERLMEELDRQHIKAEKNKQSILEFSFSGEL
ncbi:restriction endonuclease subunit S [uncultured Cycloclasticus sp.]|uniref:restriction endonuclease subunit S n=1 Tax=uncultured Cycloclasticus sp. TaxID=172194 RepID=UPI002584FF74|nr:restriction endonuclease subunit S [uncultured Cycloclasticus sp.]